jgi:hypothetical protein
MASRNLRRDISSSAFDSSFSPMTPPFRERMRIRFFITYPITFADRRPFLTVGWKIACL